MHKQEWRESHVTATDTAGVPAGFFAGTRPPRAGVYSGRPFFPDGRCRQFSGTCAGIFCRCGGVWFLSAGFCGVDPLSLGSLLRAGIAANAVHCLCADKTVTGNGFPPAVDTGRIGGKCAERHCPSAVCSADPAALSRSGEHSGGTAHYGFFREHDAGLGELHL